MPDDPNCTAGTCPHYAQNVDNWREIRANRNIKKFEFRVDTFDTEPNYDYLEWRELGGTSQYLHGTPTTGWYGVQVSQNLQAKPVELGFHSDPSIARPGFTIGRARVCGGSSTSMEPANLTLTRLNTGVLMGSGDVVYLKTPARPPGEKLNLVLWGTPGVDFDLYARCNALPTPTTYNYLAYSGDVQEFLSLDGAACTSPGTWYIAVHSFSGSGQFNLVVSPMYAAQERTLVKAGTNWNATQAELDAIANTLRGAGRHFFGMTEGQFLTKNFELYNNTGATCSNCGGETCIICFRNAPGTGYCCDGSQYVIFDSYRLDPEGVAHEFGHGYLAVWDEYNQSTQKPQCGHSNMAWPWGTQNNLCYEKDHTKDRYPSEAATTQPACWDGGVDTGRTPLVILGQTPDNYDYRDHDFNGFVDVVQK